MAFYKRRSALTRLLNDIYCTADSGSQSLSLLILMDLSAAFDTLYIDTLIRRLPWTFGIDGSALDWIRSYFTDRSQFVHIGESESGRVTFGIPHASVLGPILLTLYVAPVANVIASHGVCHLQYADDTQLYIALKNENSIAKLQNRANDVYSLFAQASK